jgi:hypothetical protein
MDTLFLSSKVALRAFLLFSFKIFHNAILYTPSQKVELGARRREPLKLDALRATKRIKEFFRVSIQTRLVGDMDSKHLSGRRRICHMVIFGVIGHEPFQFSK